MLTEAGVSLSSLKSEKLDTLLPSSPPSTAWLTNHGSGSGGFAENVFIADAAARVSGRQKL
jgi:hypothetical protein